MLTTVYAETTVRAVLINMPRMVATPVRSILAILPERVRHRMRYPAASNSRPQARAARMLPLLSARCVCVP